MLANVRFALADPLALGANVTVKEVDVPAGMVTGSAIPESANSLPPIVAEETVTAAPVAVRLPLSDELDPTDTVPKLRLAGETDS